MLASLSRCHSLGFTTVVLPNTRRRGSSYGNLCLGRCMRPSVRLTKASCFILLLLPRIPRTDKRWPNPSWNALVLCWSSWHALCLQSRTCTRSYLALRAPCTRPYMPLRTAHRRSETSGSSETGGGCTGPSKTWNASTGDCQAGRRSSGTSEASRGFPGPNEAGWVSSGTSKTCNASSRASKALQRSSRAS